MYRQLYMYVTSDKYELPIAVGTLPELATSLNMSQSSIMTYLSRNRVTRYGKFVKLGFTDKEVFEECE